MSKCWVIERHDLPYDGGNAPFRYFTWPAGYFKDGFEDHWDGHWERALKFFDRDSCEMVCAEMPFEWDVKIREREVVDGPGVIENHWTCKCKCRHSLQDDACPLCGERRSQVFKREVDTAIDEEKP